MAKSSTLTWVEINKKALIGNVRSLRKLLPRKCKGMFVIKANAYGHGIQEVLSILKNEPAVDYFGVFTFEDALLIRQKSKKPVLVLCSLEQSWIQEAAKFSIELTVSNLDQLIYLKKAKLRKKIKIHIKVDTGLGRQGFLKKDMHTVAALLDGIEGIEVIGLYTHFSGTESRYFDVYTVKQVTELVEWKDALAHVGMYPLVHASATSGVIRTPELGCDMVRFGIGTYGLWPGTETELANKGKTKLFPVLSWRARVVEVKDLAAGSYIAYDCTCQVNKKTKIAVLPVGYWDGLPRSASNQGWVLIKGFGRLV
jgi:alanine racemase